MTSDDLYNNINFLVKVDEHKKLFSLADLGGQIMKLNEEFQEYKDANSDEERYKELADCFICCIGIYRFAPLVSRAMIAHLINHQSDKSLKIIIDEINKKWQINLNRTWEYKDGKYHHV
jgi:hypothetical protein